LGANIPDYAHVPMILGADGKRLSKRHGAVSVMQYHEDGYLADALLNYLVRLGWSYGDQEIFTREEMIELFSLEGINRAASTFNPEKLQWINQQYMKNAELSKIVSLVEQKLKHSGITVESDHDISPVVDLYRERVKTINELAESILYIFQDFEEFEPKAANKNLKNTALVPLQKLQEQLSGLKQWQADDIHRVIASVTEELGINMGKVGQPLRVAVTGGSFSPPIDLTVEIIGKQKTLLRLQRAIDFIGRDIT
jgi:glutamyl-tRNA synthetase